MLYASALGAGSSAAVDELRVAVRMGRHRRNGGARASTPAVLYGRRAPKRGGMGKDSPLVRCNADLGAECAPALPSQSPTPLCSAQRNAGHALAASLRRVEVEGVSTAVAAVAAS